MQLRDLLNALTGQHEDAHRAGVGRVHRHVRTLKPAVKLHELVPIEPAGAGGFRFSWNVCRRIAHKLKTTWGSAAVVELRFQAPRVCGAEIAAHVVSHSPLTARINRA